MKLLRHLLPSSPIGSVLFLGGCGGGQPDERNTVGVAFETLQTEYWLDWA